MVINAGYALGGPFLDLTDDEIERHVQVNINHVVYTARATLGQLVKRYETSKKRSAVVITSSILSTIPLSGVTTYCASKVFDSYLAEGLNMEYKKAIDIMSYQPGGVATKMIQEFKASMTTIMPEMAADVCFRDIGIRQMTRGAFRHEFFTWMMGCFPRKMFQAMGAEGSKKELAKIRAIRDKEKEATH